MSVSATLSIPGAALSPWLDGDEGSLHPKLEEAIDVDVLVVGGGIVGVTAAFALAERGSEVALIEAGRIAGGTTGHTTAKLSSLQGLVYSTINDLHGPAAAAAYAQLNTSGIELVAGLVERLGIDCDFQRRPHYVYTEDPSRQDDLERELGLAREAGLAVGFEPALDLPYEVAGALRIGDQAQFDPVRYVRGLASAAERLGARLFENSPATGSTLRAPYRIDVATGAQITAERLIVATHMPFLDRGLAFARMTPYRSYALAVRTPDPMPSGMYISVDDPTRTLRRIPRTEGDLLLLGGGSHKAGTDSPSDKYDDLVAFARDRFAATSIEYHWSAQDPVAFDHLPMIGPLHPGGSAIGTATGFAKWGLAAGSAAGWELAERAATGQPAASWAATFDPLRLTPGALPELAKENAHVAGRFLGDRARGGWGKDLDDIAPGEGRIVRRGLAQVAAARDAGGQLHLLSARCTHLGCIVAWNAAEQSWDCPCHGSRFGLDGVVLEGPASAGLRVES